MPIGFIGLGIMGSRMAANLQKKGFALVVYNRSKDKANSLLVNGAVWADCPADVASQVDVLFSMVSTPEAVEEVAFGVNGFLETLKPGALWIDCSTVNPSFSRKMAEEAHKRGVRFLDAPVAGSLVPAEKGILTFLVGGEANDVEACRPYFEAMGQKVVHVGENGLGASMKMVFNLNFGVAMLGFLEGLVLGEALGISRQAIFDALSGSIVVAPISINKRAKIESGDYSPEFPLQWLQKDLTLASLSAYEQGVAMPTVNTAKEVYSLAKRAGLGEEDFSAVYKFLKGE